MDSQKCKNIFNKHFFKIKTDFVWFITLLKDLLLKGTFI